MVAVPQQQQTRQQSAWAARTSATLNLYASVLLAEGLLKSQVDGTSPRGVGVQMATMHRAKGLEFRADITRGLLSGRGAPALERR